MKQSNYIGFRNAVADHGAACRLSVLVPVYNVDPAPLLRSLLCCCADVEVPVEILVGDDGSESRYALARAVREMRTAVVPCALLTWRPNRGRSAARNLLCRHADGLYVLYLDGDVAITGTGFLATYLALIQQSAPPMAAGGFRMEEPARCEPRYRLQHYVSRRLHDLPPSVRSRHPGRYAYASNLLVRRRLLLEQPFDERFRAWGWEDVELGFRFSGQGAIVHVDNPVLHRGYQSSRSLVERWEASVPNFRRLCQAHSRQATLLPIYRASRVVARLPAVSLMRSMLRRVVLSERRWIPLTVRYWSWKLLRAAIYADALPATRRAHRHVLSEAG